MCFPLAKCGAGDGARKDYLIASGRCQATGSCRALPSKRDKVFLRRCVLLAEEDGGAFRPKSSSGALVRLGGRRAVRARTQTAGKSLMRQPKTQGAPYKCPLIREYLYDWFVDIRRSVAGRISPKFVLLKARNLADLILQAQRATGHYTPMPKLDKHWLLRWKRDKGIVFRKPNQRIKASRQKMMTRLVAMWLNVFRVRYLAVKFLGFDIGVCIFSVDEKPLHFNEGGSKAIRTLEIQGAPAVRLKENHSASRERVSVMTATTSDMQAILQPGGLPAPRRAGQEGCVGSFLSAGLRGPNRRRGYLTFRSALGRRAFCTGLFDFQVPGPRLPSAKSGGRWVGLRPFL